MISMKEWLELVGYKITEGSEYQWQCYGSNAHCLDSWNGDHDGYSSSIIFDTKTQEVYEVQTYDYANNRAYRMINPAYAKKNRKENKRRGLNHLEAWEGVEYVDLELEDDFAEKTTAIVNGQPYDTRIQVPIDMPDHELLQYMKMAHERNMTFNDFVTEALVYAIEQHKAQEKLDDQQFSS